MVRWRCGCQVWRARRKKDQWPAILSDCPREGVTEMVATLQVTRSAGGKRRDRVMGVDKG